MNVLGVRKLMLQSALVILCQKGCFDPIKNIFAETN